MLYLLDANILITAKNFYYEMERIPEFWEWLVYHGEQGNIKIPFHIYGEYKAGNDGLTDWIIQKDVTEALLLHEEVDAKLVTDTLINGYGENLSDVELEKIAMDPFLITHGRMDVDNRVVVSAEVSKRSAQRSKRRVPDVCNDFGVTCTDIYGLNRALNFSTSWAKEI